MRRSLSAVGLLLLAAAVILGAGACQREAGVRQPEEGQQQAEATSVAMEGEAVPTSATVVSAVMTPYGTAALPTPSVVSPTATVVLEPLAVPTAQPVATEPPASVLPTTGTGGETVSYTVQAGDTLAAIADRYGTTTAAIVAANDLADPNQIFVGQELKIPTTEGTAGGTAGGTEGCRFRHTVKQGEWVWQLARSYGVSPYDILKANGLTIDSANTIYPGMVLCIP